MNTSDDTPRPETCDVLVVGAGFAGLYAVHRSVAAGFTTIGVEAAPGVGGTWYWNRYPGARCDVESIDYSYSFDAELQDSWVWSERYATQPEIHAYLEHVADRFGLRRHFRFGRRVEGARFDEGSSAWTVTADTGHAYRARFLVLATGSLSAPHRPDIPGAGDFAGEVLFTARWPHENVSFAGKRVGVIGTGSSGIQSIPIIAEEAASLTVFQRSPNYSVPAFNRPLTEEEQVRIRAEYPERRRKSAYSGAGTPHETYPRGAFEIDEAERRAAFEARWREGGVLFGKTFPNQTVDEAVNRLARDFAEAKIRAIVTDRRVADDLVPVDHPIGTKRICTDSGYYETFNRADVTLVNLRREPITAITERGIRTATGSYELDTIVYATGFDAMTGAVTQIDIRGARGSGIGEAWANGPVTYLGMAIPGFPNLFTVNGPGSPSVLANMVLTAEQQVDWLIDLIADCRRRGVTEVEARADAAAKWTEHVSEAAHRTLFPLAGSWYMGANIEGKSRIFMPYIGGFGNYRRICDQVRADGYEGFVLTERKGTEAMTGPTSAVRTTADRPVISLAGKVAIITGAARGQGAAEAELFVRLGATVVITDTNERDGTALAGRLGPSASFRPLDVTDGAAWSRVVAETAAVHGRIDVLVNNAGVWRKAPLEEWTEDELRGMFDVNLLGPILGMRAVAPTMSVTGGSIVNVASTAGIRGHGGALPYASSKWGLRGASRSAAQEYAPRGIRVNCVCPGVVDTPMIDAAALDLSRQPMPRAGTAEEIANMVAFLASDAGAYCTGADFVVDGGATA